MKRLIAMLLSAALLVSGCAQNAAVATSSTEATTLAVVETTETEPIAEEEALDNEPVEDVEYTYEPEFNSLNDDELLVYVENAVYESVVADLDSADYFVENVDAVYISQEYLEEAAYNSQSNIFFGYTLDEIEEIYPDTQYVFTLGDDGTTVVQPMEGYDDTYEKVIKNVAIGGGVILVCVTVSVVTAGAGAPAISMIFAASAKTGTAMALSSGAMGAAAAGIVTGVQTGDVNQALKAAAVGGSEGFKWGAISGAVAGGATEAIALKGASLNGLTMNEAALIQKDSGYPLDVIKDFKSMDEYQIYKDAGLKAQRINGKIALVQDVDLNQQVTLPSGEKVTNRWLIENGQSPVSPEGYTYELHHINQDADGTLAILTEKQHRGPGMAKILNQPGKVGVHNAESGLSDLEWGNQRKAFWMDYLNQYLMSGGK